MKTTPLSIRLDKELHSLLSEGERRALFIAPWPRGALAEAYGRVDKEWEHTEAAATASQGQPSWKD